MADASKSDAYLQFCYLGGNVVCLLKTIIFRKTSEIEVKKVEEKKYLNDLEFCQDCHPVYNGK